MGTHRQKVNFEMGELVRVVDSTFQKGMSPTRIGVITGVGRDDSGFHTGVYEVLFASGEGTLKMQFWHKFLEKVIV